MLTMLLRKLIFLFTEVSIIPKSKNNGNDHDYIYLDMLNGDNVGQFISVEKICVGKSSKLNLPELLEKKPTEGNVILT